MKSALPLLSLALLASCTTYKSGQTPDDVYFSPERPREEYVKREDKDDERKYRSDDEAYRDDRYLRMKVHNRRWSGLYQEDYYSYNPYYYHYYNNALYFNSPWNSYSYWNYYYNPTCHSSNNYNIKTPVYNRPRTFDLSYYNPQPQSSSPGKSPRVVNPNNYGNSTRSTNTRSTNTRSNSNSGSFLRDVFSGSSGSSSSGSTPGSSTRSSSSSSSGSSGGSSGGSAPVRRF
jgi:hypothetical protein